MVELTVENFKDIYMKQIGRNAEFLKPKEIQTLYDLNATWRDDEIQQDIDASS